MTFDWTTAKLFMKEGKKVRSSSWWWGNFLELRKTVNSLGVESERRYYVDNGEHTWTPEDLSSAKKHMSWEVYIEPIHGATDYRT